MKDYNDSLEKAILACLILKPSLFEELLLNEKHFVKYQEFYNVLKKNYVKHKTIDITLICSDDSTPDNFIDFYTELVNEGCFVSNFNSYINEQIENYKKYRIFELIEQYTNKKIGYSELVQNINLEYNDKLDFTLKKTEQEIYELITLSQEYINFDKMINLGKKVKFLKHTFNVIAARPSVGKSAFALNMIEDLSKNYRCLYFNMEMTEKEMYERLVAINTGIPIDNVCNPVTEYQDNAIKQSIHSLVNRNLKIVNGSKNIETLKNIIINEQKKEHVLVFIDYIGYVYALKNMNDRERIGYVVRELQNLTKDYNITIFCLAQINREGAEEPTKETIKDSGELEQTAHALVLLHNVSINPLVEQEPLMKIIVAKNRSGKTGYFNMKFKKSNQVFYEENK